MNKDKFQADQSECCFDSHDYDIILKQQSDDIINREWFMSANKYAYKMVPATLGIIFGELSK